MQDIFTFRGKRAFGLDSSIKTKKDGRKIGDILSPLLKKCVSAYKKTRGHLILLQNDLVEQVMAKDDPEGFITETIAIRFRASFLIWSHFLWIVKSIVAK